MVSVRKFLVRGLLAGLFAGLITFGVAYVVGEPSVNAAISIEEAGSTEHSHAAEPTGGEQETVVPRSLQSTLGLLTATGVAGTTLGGLLAVLSALALGRFGGLGARATTLLVTGVGFVACTLVTFFGYPPNPPAVGHADTIAIRSGLYFVLLSISVILAVTAVVVGRMLARRWGAWYAGLAVVAGYLLLVVAAVALLPTYDEVPADFPASVLWSFRIGSLLTQLTLWGVLGLSLAELVHRLTRRSAGLAQARTTYAESVR